MASSTVVAIPRRSGGIARRHPVLEALRARSSQPARDRQRPSWRRAHFAAPLTRAPKLAGPKNPRMERPNGPQRTKIIKPLWATTGLNPADLNANWQNPGESHQHRLSGLVQVFSAQPGAVRYRFTRERPLGLNLAWRDHEAHASRRISPPESAFSPSDQKTGGGSQSAERHALSLSGQAVGQGAVEQPR